MSRQNSDISPVRLPSYGSQGLTSLYDFKMYARIFPVSMNPHSQIKVTYIYDKTIDVYDTMTEYQWEEGIVLVMGNKMNMGRWR